MLKRLSATALILAAASPAWAHLDPGQHGSLLAGISHPLAGADHMLAMIAVGIWAGQIGGSARWAAPISFVLVMAAGFGLALGGVSLPFVEPAILASVIGLGLLAALAVRLPAPTCAALVGVFALFHGHAHGSVLDAGSALVFACGFMLATVGLHLAGVGVGMLAGRRASAIGRLLGAATALAGTALALG